MSEEPKYTEEFQYNKLAEEYNEKKKESILNILICGKIISDAKKELEHGKFLNWLKDNRVQESEKTSQRLMQVHKNYRHLLLKSDEDFGTLEKIGMVKMLELTKLPTIFKKTVEIENESGHKELIEVMDEEKVDNLLEKGVSVDGTIKPIKNLPLSKFKEIIKEQSGEFKSDSLASDSGDEEESKGDSQNEHVSTSSVSFLQSTLQAISSLSSQVTSLMTDIDNYGEARLYDMLDEDKTKMKQELNRLKSHMEGLIVKINDFEGK